MNTEGPGEVRGLVVAGKAGRVKGTKQMGGDSAGEVEIKIFGGPMTREDSLIGSTEEMM